MIKSRFAINIHILTILAIKKNDWVSSELIANSMNINAVLVRKELSQLKKNNIIVSKEGKGGGCKLAKSAEEITFGELFLLIKESHIFSFARNEPCPECSIGNKLKEHLQPIYEQIDDAIFQTLQPITLAEFSNKFN